MRDLLSMEQKDMEALAAELDYPAFRGRQLYDWVQRREVFDWAQMNNLPREFRERASSVCSFGLGEVIDRRATADGDTVKLLLRLEDGEAVETVLMSYRREQSRDRTTLCVSTQAGCAMNCLFCASGQGGLRRQLTAGEIVAQVCAANEYLRAHDREPISNVVYMGMGEPLQNLDAVLRSLAIFNEAKNIGMRRMTVSTCGLVPGIRRLTELNYQFTLAVSLHAPDDALRDRLMPVNRRYPLAELFAAIDDYTAATRRRVTYEYALFEGINDSEEQAHALARLLHGRLAHVNLIAGNPVAESGLYASPSRQVRRFCEVLDEAGIEASVRESRGRLIDGACGQLRLRHKNIQ